MTRLAGLNLILKFDVVKSSKCHVCVEAKQPRKPHKASTARELAVTPLGVKHALTFQSMIISIAYMFIIRCNIS
jgi:hypothetical protein